jgi:Tetracyclin repressor-like, C-terminal domain
MIAGPARAPRDFDQACKCAVAGGPGLLACDLDHRALHDRGTVPRLAGGYGSLGPETLHGILGDYFADTESVAAFQDQVLHIGAGVMATILKHAEERGEVRHGISPRVNSLPTDLFRHELLIRRTPPTRRVITEIIDEVFLPLVQRKVNTLRQER